jgi:hypothetical protein
VGSLPVQEPPFLFRTYFLDAVVEYSTPASLSTVFSQSSDGTLRASDTGSAQSIEKAADVVHVIADSKTAPNHVGDSGIRPSIARIAVDRGAAEKNAAELPPIVDG